MRPGALLLAVATAVGCREATSALGPTPHEAQASAHEVLGALAARFGPHRLDPNYASARPKLAGASLVPSRVFDDASIWTGRHGEEPVLELFGRLEAEAYRLRPWPGAPAPARSADYGGTLRLRRLAPGEYEWSMREELAIGSVTAEALSSVLTAVFRGAEAGGARDARAIPRGMLPRTAAALGRGISLEQLNVTPGADGAAAVTVRVALDPSGLDRDFPHYARFLRRQAVPLRFRARATDESGARWWELDAAEGHAALSLGVRGGDLAPLDAAPRPCPARLRVAVGLTTRSGLFRVGFSGLEAEASLVREPHEKRVTARFRRAPEWRLPFLVEPLLRSSLRRPFEDDGALLAYAVHDAPGQPTLLAREYRLSVRESWIVRWLGGIVGGAVAEFRRDAEEEADSFVSQALRALDADAAEIIGGPTTGRYENPGHTENSEPD